VVVVTEEVVVVTEEVVAITVVVVTEKVVAAEVYTGYFVAAEVVEPIAVVVVIAKAEEVVVTLNNAETVVKAAGIAIANRLSRPGTYHHRGHKRAHRKDQEYTSQKRVASLSIIEAGLWAAPPRVT
jgi:hypothetical protein